MNLTTTKHEEEEKGNGGRDATITYLEGSLAPGGEGGRADDMPND